MVLFDLLDYKKRRRLSLHSKIVLTITLILIIFGTLSIFLVEDDKSFQHLPFKTKMLASLFQSITARTAGFNTVDLTLLNPSTCFILIILMFIGASPGSCGGGVKTSTMGILAFSVKSQILGDPETFAFKRTISRDNIGKALTIVVSAMFTVSLSLFLLLNWGLPYLKGNYFLKTIFEVVSAFGTVGLSLGITPELTTFGKVVIILTMFAGRLGPLTLAYALRIKEKKVRFSYPVERVMVG